MLDVRNYGTPPIAMRAFADTIAPPIACSACTRLSASFNFRYSGKYPACRASRTARINTVSSAGSQRYRTTCAE